MKVNLLLKEGTIGDTNASKYIRNNFYVNLQKLTTLTFSGCMQSNKIFKS